jgi:GDP/UDP-N,N'-diacetylbacillosamine 2-epimerase (hydrolysing)
MLRGNERKSPDHALAGGETTQGAIDEAVRHAVTKMSLLHFTSNEMHRRRVIQLGENPSRVFNVGAVGVETR